MIVLSLILSLLFNAVDTTASNPNDPIQIENSDQDRPSFIITVDEEP